jgi:hypothetical protein
LVLTPGIAEQIVHPARAPVTARCPRGADRIAQLPLSEARRLGRVRPAGADARQLATQLALAQSPARHLRLQSAHTPSQLGEQVAEFGGQALGLLEMVVAARSRGGSL